jgi:hypothetical protein
MKDMNLPIKIVVQGGEYVSSEDPKKPGKFWRLPGNFEKDRYFIGSLKLGSREDVVGVARNYADRLGDILLEIYQQLDNLTKNVNEYFLENKKDAAVRAQSNAAVLKSETDQLV